MSLVRIYLNAKYLLWKIESDIKVAGTSKNFARDSIKLHERLRLIVVEIVRLRFMESDVFPEYVIFMDRHVWNKCENP